MKRDWYLFIEESDGQRRGCTLEEAREFARMALSKQWEPWPPYSAFRVDTEDAANGAVA